MAISTPIVLVPGLNCSARIYTNHVARLWRFGPVTIANHMHGDTIEAIARHILACAPPRFALVGFSMGGYISFEMMRQAPDRVSKLALLDTSARPDTPEQSERRAERIAMARNGHFSESLDLQYPISFITAVEMIMNCVSNIAEWPKNTEPMPLCAILSRPV